MEEAEAEEEDEEDEAQSIELNDGHCSHTTVTRLPRCKPSTAIARSAEATLARCDSVSSSCPRPAKGSVRSRTSTRMASQICVRVGVSVRVSRRPGSSINCRGGME